MVLVSWRPYGYGRELTLRGINLKAEGLFDATFSDGRIANEVVPPWDASEATDMVQLGFNWVRQRQLVPDRQEPQVGQLGLRAVARVRPPYACERQ